MIEAEGLTRSYDYFMAVVAVSFRIDHGEIVGLLGHNGAGKTTIMKMLTGVLEPDGGRVRVDGLDPRDQGTEVRGRIGYLPENCPVYPEMTVIDYLDYAAALHGVSESRRPALLRTAVARTELQAKALRPIATLSRGYRQRVGVAQAILHEPRVLILDEPTNGLDPAQIQHMRDLVRTLAEQATVIVSTHILQEVQAVCDRVIILRGGRKVLDGRLADLAGGGRLLVALDAAPEAALPVLGGIDRVARAEPLDHEDGVHRYALEPGESGARAVAPAVARRIAEQGWSLYGLEAERQDLETLFARVTAGADAQAGEVAHG